MTRFDDELAIPSFPVSGFAPRLLRHGSPSLRSWRSRCVRRVGYPRFFHRPLPVTIPNSTCPMVPKCYRPRASFHLSHRIPPPATRHHLPRHRPARHTHRHDRRGPRLGPLPDHPAARAGRCSQHRQLHPRRPRSSGSPPRARRPEPGTRAVRCRHKQEQRRPGARRERNTRNECVPHGTWMRMYEKWLRLVGPTGGPPAPSYRD